MNNDNQMEWIDDMDDVYIYIYIYVYIYTYVYIYGIDNNNHPMC